MSPGPHFTVAICGAGLAGLGLALALRSRGISCIIYEARSTATSSIKGSLQLAPNGQAALASYDILPQLAAQSCFFKNASIWDKHGNSIKELSLGGKEAFGYDSMRIIRARLIGELVKAVEDKNVPIVYNKKFIRVSSESEDGVTIEFADGTTGKASLLIGADGIWSRVRRSLYPDISPEYIGHTVVGTSVEKSKVEGLQPEHAGLYIGDHGAFLLGQHVPDHSEYMVGLQKPYPDLGRSGWEALASQRENLREFLRSGYDEWPPHVKSALDNAREDSIFLWPMYTLPKLESWRSNQGRVLLIGDAAHAIPPSGGQGANMAFEDAHSLCLVLATYDQGIGSPKPGCTLDEALDFWQKMRQERIEAVLNYTMQQNRARQAPETKAETKAEIVQDQVPVRSGGSTGGNEMEHMRWLFGGVAEQEEKIHDWAGYFETKQ